MSGAVFPLQDNQLKAADPRGNVWLSASAGTGKTQVLSARVLRLLLTPGVDPSQILCLTFTKAGAAEMANRINAVLARWVRLDAGALGKELKHLGARIDPSTLFRQRACGVSMMCPRHWRSMKAKRFALKWSQETSCFGIRKRSMGRTQTDPRHEADVFMSSATWRRRLVTRASLSDAPDEQPNSCRSGGQGRPQRWPRRSHFL